MQNCGRNIESGNITILDKALGCLDRLMSVAVETRLHPRLFNREGVFCHLALVPGD
jgi:hypothetical protein